MARQGLNETTQRGNLGAKPELRHTKTGSAVSNFRIAVDERRGDSWITQWRDIVVFGKLAEICHQYLDKGARVEVKGRLRDDVYTDKEGHKHYRTKIEASRVDFL